MNKKVFHGAIIFSVLSVIIGGTYAILNYYNQTKDYKNVFQNNQSVVKEVYGAPFIGSGIIKVNKLSSEDEPEISLQQLQEEAKKELESSHVVNIILLGIDKDKDREEWLRVYRTDTIAVLTINLDTKKINVLSIPRDTYTFLPDINKMDKINHAYVFGGMNEGGINSIVEVVNGLIKYSSINYYFALDMEPIPQIVETLGGIEMDVDVDMDDYGIELKKGKQMLNGMEAFVYIHWRFSGNGDIDRIFRQQKFTKAMVNKLKERNQLLNSVKLVLEYRKSFKTNLSTKQIISMTNLFNDISGEDVSFSSIPGTGEYIDGISYWVPNKDGVEEVLKKHFLFN